MLQPPSPDPNISNPKKEHFLKVHVLMKGALSNCASFDWVCNDCVCFGLTLIWFGLALIVFELFGFGLILIGFALGWARVARDRFWFGLGLLWAASAWFRFALG